MDIHSGKYTLRKNCNKLEIRKWSRFVILSSIPLRRAFYLVILSPKIRVWLQSQEILDTLSSNNSSTLAWKADGDKAGKNVGGDGGGASCECDG